MIATQLSLIQTPEPTYADSDQRYTPDRFFPPIIQALGGQITLDPCSDPGKRVPAKHHLTEFDDCLTTDWSPLLSDGGTIYLNPPYSNSSPFLKRLCQYLRSGDCELAITLTLAGAIFNITMQPMFQELALATCAPLGRINFVGSSGNSNDRDVIWTLWSADPLRQGEAVDRFCKSFVGLKQVVVR